MSKRELHPLLTRQLRAFDGRAVDDRLSALIDRVNAAYVDFDSDRAMLERSLELSSAELLQANTELRAVFLELPDLVLWFDARGSIVREERGSEPESYPSGEELAANPVFFRVRRDSQRTKKTRLLELAIDFGGNPAHYEVRFMPLLPGEVLSVVRNVTTQVRGVRALAAEKERLATTLRSIGDAVLTTDRYGRVDLLNVEAERLTGVDAERAAGRLVEDVLLMGREELELRDRIAAVQQTGNDWSVEAVTLASARGIERVVDLRAAAITERSAITGVVVVFRDVAGRVRLVDERLRASKLESLGLLAGGIAHDFNNILQALLGSLSLAEHRYRLEQDISDLLARARRASTRARDLTKQLLAVSKGGAPVKSVASIRELLVEASTFAARGSKSRCHFEIDPQLAHVEIDAGQITQVIHNLVINALQAMPEGGVVRVGATNEDNFVRIYVCDAGLGIRDDHLDKLFDPYFTTKETGSGLGLYTAYVVIKRHGGSIDVKSEFGVGTTFSVRLPATAKHPTPLAGDDVVRGGLGRVLILDDQASARKTTTEMLEYLGYNACAASEGEEAVELFRDAIRGKREFDVALLDLTIPGGQGGADTVRELAKLGSAFRAIAMTGYANDEIVENYSHFGFHAVLVKPFTVLELDRALRSTE